LEEVRKGIARAAEHSGRSPHEIVLVGVVKSVSAEMVREAVDAGLADLAENRVQEAEPKIAAVGRQSARWHLVGHLQRNKSGRAVALFDRVHSVDDIELAQALSRRAVAAGRVVPVLIQVNVSGEAAKHGVAPVGLEALLEQVVRLPGLVVDGLMSIGPLVEDGEEARRYFARTRELRDRAQKRLGVSLPELSMGMSADYEVAIEEGSTMVRVGTALFGRRA
jgi:hypothetical protein